MRDLRSQRFSRLLVICPTKNRSKCGNIIWLCRCDCGNLKEISGNSLLTGLTKSCGCLQKERVAQANTTHGDAGHLRRSRLYLIWTGIKYRCLNPNDTGYKYYGKRGIGACDEWLNAYFDFRDWALANGYTDDLTIDRINNDGNYEPDNCQWITQSENSKKSFIDRKL